ncbi:hypothetical protein LOH54_06780 [Sulfurimonas sp. HSL-3221]|uniref:hypothetical protein n=1 Tax=Sulfurimonadaceae TaxID=2771471 RepID=UPI001E52DA51|nr:hypothetical protein [Sulfurimonas sp. HSL-3221]UFS61363.1 hypothetical protein LOH54_06780 [Sulfurimonas sp. HSL-3221]
MKMIEKMLHPEETILVAAEISKTFYNGILSLYGLGALLLFIGYEYEIGVIGLVLIIRTFYMHLQEIREKKHYHCVLTPERLIIHKGFKNREIIPINLEEIRTIYIKPYSERFKNHIDVGTLEVLTISGGRYVISHIKAPFAYHRAIIGDVVAATSYAKKRSRSTEA